MVACAEILTSEDKTKGPFARADLRAGNNNIPNGTTDSCWFGWQTMEERHLRVRKKQIRSCASMKRNLTRSCAGYPNGAITSVGV